MKATVRTYPSLNAFKFPEDGGSAVSVFNLILEIVAICVFTFEVILDKTKSDIQKVADTTAPGNNKWIQAQMFKFQFGDVIDLVDFVPVYDVIDLTKRIITQCAVKDIGSGVVGIKIAKGSAPPFLPLTNTELQAVKDYYYGTDTTEGIGFSGVKAQFITMDPDRIRIEANVFYFGQYVENDVKTNVVAAINAFLQSFANDSFGGRVYIIRLVDAIQQVPGVNRVELIALDGRSSATAFGSGISIPIQGYYDPVAGHIISEDHAGDTLDDTITMVQEPV